MFTLTEARLYRISRILSNYYFIFIWKMRYFKNIVFLRLVLNLFNYVWPNSLYRLFWFFWIIYWVIFIKNIFNINLWIIFKLIDFTLIKSSHEWRFILRTEFSAVNVLLLAALTMYIELSRVTQLSRLNTCFYLMDIQFYCFSLLIA